LIIEFGGPIPWESREMRSQQRREILTEHGDEVLFQRLGPSIDVGYIDFVGRTAGDDLRPPDICGEFYRTQTDGKFFMTLSAVGYRHSACRRIHRRQDIKLRGILTRFQRTGKGTSSQKEQA